MAAFKQTIIECIIGEPNNFSLLVTVHL